MKESTKVEMMVDGSPVKVRRDRDGFSVTLYGYQGSVEVGLWKHERGGKMII